MAHSHVTPTDRAARGNGFIISRDLNAHRVAVTNSRALGREPGNILLRWFSQPGKKEPSRPTTCDSVQRFVEN
jgi:hypothetical protein